MKVDTAPNSRRSTPAAAATADPVVSRGSTFTPLHHDLQRQVPIAAHRRFAAPWNFLAASLYNAAMLSRSRAAAPTSGSTAVATPARAGVHRPLWALAPAALFSMVAVASTAHAQPATANATATAPAVPTAEKPAKATPKPAGGTPGAPSGSKKPASVNKKPAPVKVGKKVIAVDEEFLVEGRLEKPSAFYVLRRSSTDYDWARLDAVFTPLVLESVQDPLF